MRALVLIDWWKLAVENLPDPVVGDHDVLVEVIATGICGSDLHGYTGDNGRRVLGQVMGHETVGKVTALGAAAADVGSTISVGDLVTVNPVIGCGTCPRCAAGSAQSCSDKTVIGVTPDRPAAFAELIAAPVGNIVPLPPAMPQAHGALVEPLAVGLHGVRRASMAADVSVLVIGGGPIGQACAMAALHDGAREVVVSELDADRRATVARIGATPVDPRQIGSVPDGVAATLGGPPDVVIDAVGSSDSLSDAFATAAPGASVVLVGMNSPDLAVRAYEISTKERTVIGSFCYTPAEFEETAAWVGTTPPGLEALIDGTVGLDDAPEAFRALVAGEWAASKVLVQP